MRSLECWRNALTRAVGTQSVETPDVTSHPMEPGDRFLLCSDGLWSAIPEVQIVSSLFRCRAEEGARLLVELANEAGGADNATALVIDIEAVDSQGD